MQLQIPRYAHFKTASISTRGNLSSGYNGISGLSGKRKRSPTNAAYCSCSFVGTFELGKYILRFALSAARSAILS